MTMMVLGATLLVALVLACLRLHPLVSTCPDDPDEVLAAHDDS